MKRSRRAEYTAFAQRVSVASLALLILLIAPAVAFDFSAVSSVSLINEHAPVSGVDSAKTMVVAGTPVGTVDSEVCDDTEAETATAVEASISDKYGVERARARARVILNELSVWADSFDGRFFADSDAVAAVDTWTVDHSIQAGLSLPSLMGSSAAIGSDGFGGAWIVLLSLVGLAVLLVLLTKYIVTRRSATELEDLVRERTRQLQQSSEHYRSLVQNAVVGIFRATAGGRIETSNPALGRILCCDREGDLSVRNLRDDIFVDPQQWEHLCDIGRGKGWIEGLEAEWMRCDGTTAMVRLSGRWIDPKDGSEPVCELIAEDITALLNARIAEIEAERLRGVQKLAIAVAHEFNNPLSILLGTYQLYIEPNMHHYDEDVQERLARMPETISRMRDLVARLLRITRLRENEYILGTSYLNLAQSAEDEEDSPFPAELEELLEQSSRTDVSFP